MSLPDIIVIAVCVLILAGAAAYIIISKRKGKKCIGCPYSSICRGSSSCGKKK